MYAECSRTMCWAVCQYCDDDGTTGVISVMVVVSRWRGRVNIGPDRFRHINSEPRQVLQQLGFVKKN
ncbi:hypothetical protein J6590_026782 [Homalodisca vitripennis]|nr:hypothetical protein J6590_026782 [Homalodisca vitripennis]